MSFKEVNTIKLEDVVISSNTGADAIKRSPIVEENTGMRCLRIGDVSNNRQFKEWGFTNAEQNVIDKFSLKKDDIVIARTGNTIGVVRYIEKDLKSVYNNGLIRLKIDKERYDAKYVYYNLASQHFKDFVYSISGGTSTQPNMKIDHTLKYEISNFSLEEQNAISQILSNLDKKIETNNKINKKLEEMAQAIFKQWFVDFKPFKDDAFIETECGSIPKSWNIEILDKCCALITKGITPKYVDESEQRVINQKCIRNNKIDLRLVRFHEPKKINEKWLEYGDILINSTGQGTLGRVAQVLEPPINLTVDSHVTIVRPKKKQLINYLGCLLLTKQSVFEGMASGSTGQTDLPRDLVKAMKIILPCEQVLKHFSGVVNPLREQMILLQNENIKLENLRDTLLPKLMSGEIRVPLK